MRIESGHNYTAVPEAMISNALDKLSRDDLTRLAFKGSMEQEQVEAVLEGQFQGTWLTWQKENTLYFSIRALDGSIHHHFIKWNPYTRSFDNWSDQNHKSVDALIAYKIAEGRLQGIALPLS